MRRPEGARRERYRSYVCRIEAYIVAAGGAVRGGSAFCGVGRRRFRCGKMVVAEREERCGARVSAGYSGEEFTCFTKSGYG